MKMKELLKMNLQHFAEPNPENPADENPGAEGDPEGGEGKGDVKTLTQEEVNRLIAQSKSKAKNEARRELEAEYESKLQSAVEEAVKKSQMSDEEKETYEQVEARRKLEKQANELAETNKQLQDRVNELEAQINQHTLQENATKTLTEKGIVPSERNLKLVLRGAETPDDVLEAIDLLADTLAEEKKVSAQTQPPKASGGFVDDQPKSATSILDSAKITKY